ncbi:DUF4870 domain-containing protein [Brasilonema sp. UFV-L1]|uniref:DUF4870 domain-containing protein n=1 Tax=Brasilonema sp. UFV-L1 TaxID=2234130 RepID=UPI00145DBD76|nr:DUF4870 domain-containing protein [Brasilonema sp. UFV-L1]NMG11694.1 hypothetical protein [Brasilonema sp. UFV-L1]
MRKSPEQQVRIWAMLCHLSALLWLPLAGLLFLGIPLYLPFMNSLGPLIIWHWKKTKDPWIDFQGKESLNFQLSLIFYAFIVITVLLFLVVLTFGIAMTTTLIAKSLETILNSFLVFFCAFILFLMISQLFLVNFAAIKAYKGQYYRYPFTIRFLK